MKARLIVTAVFIVTCCFLFLNDARSENQTLSSDARRVADYLLEDWKKQFRSTTIPQAMSNLGIEPNDDLRMEIARYFRDNSQLTNNLKYWGINNYILSNEEKLIAKFLMNDYASKNKMREAEEISKRLGISSDRVKDRLNFLVKAGLLVQPSAQEPDSYMLSEGFERWAGPLRLNFHTVSVAGEKPYDVW